MKDETLFRLGGLSAITGGALRAANAFTTGVLSEAVLQQLYFATDVLLIFGLVAIYLRVRDNVGWAGFAGFIVAVVGLLMVRSGALFGGYQTGASVALLGTVLFGLTLLAARQGIVAPLLWTASLILGLAAMISPALAWAATLAGAVFGIGFVTAGLRLTGVPSR